MLDRKKSAFSWIDGVWLLFLLALAFLPPIREFHKQAILIAIGLAQVFEGRMVAWSPRRGPAYTVLIKIALATLLLDHTGDVGINSSYYPIYYLPVVTAAVYFGPLGTLAWTAVAGLAYASLLIPANIEYEITAESYYLLAIRILFFFLAAMLVNRFAVENRRQVEAQRALSATLETTNEQLRKAEAEARRSERLAALGQLSAGLAHEIRNPLGVIKGSAEMLAQKLEDSHPLAAELSGNIYSEVNRLNDLVARFLDFARPLRLEQHAVAVTDIVDRAAESVHVQISDAQVKIERNYSANLPPVLADERFCESVFANLITNAYQAMGGHGTLRLSARPESSNGSRGVAVTVEDTGPGVAPEMREQIFNPFITSKRDGVGLGLSIVAKIVDEHRGWIRLEPADETGTSTGARFKVFLPAPPAAENTSN